LQILIKHATKYLSFKDIGQVILGEIVIKKLAP
jgi:hypothetical protein